MSDVAAAIWLFALVQQHVPSDERRGWGACFAHLDPDAYRFAFGRQPDVAELTDEVRIAGVDHLAVWIFGSYGAPIDREPRPVRDLAVQWYRRLGGEEGPRVAALH